MNDKKAKMLRAAAKYDPSAPQPKMPFPGVARAYKHPVYATRLTTKTSYVRLPMDSKTTKVRTQVRRMVTDNREKPVLEMETHQPGTLPTAFGPDGKPTAFNKHVVVRPKEQLVPVSKPGRHAPRSPKGVYRGLKRLAKKGLLTGLGTAIVNAYQQGEVRA